MFYCLGCPVAGFSLYFVFLGRLSMVRFVTFFVLANLLVLSYTLLGSIFQICDNGGQLIRAQWLLNYITLYIYTFILLKRADG